MQNLSNKLNIMDIIQFYNTYHYHSEISEHASGCERGSGSTGNATSQNRATELAVSIVRTPSSTG